MGHAQQGLGSCCCSSCTLSGGVNLGGMDASLYEGFRHQHVRSGLLVCMVEQFPADALLCE